MSMYRRGWRDAAHTLAEPYPDTFFTPLSNDEYGRIRQALFDHCDVHAPLDRMHAQWARHWSNVLLKEADGR